MDEPCFIAIQRKGRKACTKTNYGKPFGFLGFPTSEPLLAVMAEGTGIIVCSTSVVRCIYATSNHTVFKSESHDLGLKNHIFSLYHSF
jgi:hypothetical protein